MRRRRLGKALVSAVVLSAPAARGTELLANGGFDTGALGWETPGWWAGGSGTTQLDGGRLCTTVETVGTADWGAQLRQTGLTLYRDAVYTVRFHVWSSVPLTLPVSVIDEVSGFADVLGFDVEIDAPLQGAPAEVEIPLPALVDTATANFRFLLGGGIVPAGETLCVGAVGLDGPLNLVENPGFDAGSALGWEVGQFGGEALAGVDGAGRLCAEVTSAGEGLGALQIRQSDLPLVAGRSYSVSADVWASSAATVVLDVTDEVAQATAFALQSPIAAPLEGPPQPLFGSFVAGADSGVAKLRLLLGGGGVPPGETVCVDNLRLLDPLAEPAVDRPPPPPLHVNQLGYLPAMPKRASYALPAGAAEPEVPRLWELLSGQGVEERVVARGTTLPFGSDAASGDVVHHIDFGAVTEPGDGYRLVVLEGEGRVESFPFAIRADLYEAIKYDALAYFYHNRSGTPILAEVVGEPWARPAGHLGDAQVELLSCAGEDGCPTRDVSGGWYDAGDHGKYVVNGGISVWTLLSQYERAKFVGGNLENFADGSLFLPETERSNGVPDLLDEARWEVEWFLRMQVPEGEPSAGMVSHKMHDAQWTPLPTRPDLDPQPRYIHPPSTAATLNFAAVAAQCARVWESLDPALAARCLEQARVAFDAALAQPDRYSPGGAAGGGGYTDGNVEDEFYWAAAELYVTTGELRYESFLRAHPLHLLAQPPSGTGRAGFLNWPQTNGLGLVSLATAGPWYGRSPALVRGARRALIEVAESYRALTSEGGYPVPLAADAYAWGSNSTLLNNAMVMALAADFTCEDQYAEAVHEVAAYLLGRNPLGTSYVTGYGSHPVRYPHHRFWAGVLDPAFPLAPPGAVAGGPNSGLQDPIAQWLEGCPAQRCFVDDINAWSLNEITINWNAPLSWVMAYLDERGREPQASYAAARCRARARGTWPLGGSANSWRVERGRARLEPRLDEGGAGGLGVHLRGPAVLSSGATPLGELEVLGDTLSMEVESTLFEGGAQALQVSAELRVAGRPSEATFELGSVSVGEAGPLTLSWKLPAEAREVLLSGEGLARLRLGLRGQGRGERSLRLGELHFTGDIWTREGAGSAPLGRGQRPERTCSPGANARRPRRSHR